MSEHRALAALAALAAVTGSAGCGPGPDAPWSSVVLGLSAAPERVDSLGVSVLDPAREQVVASATVPADRAEILLGVPAERPLEFRVVAWTRDPGPAPLERMPAFVGLVLRSIPLGRERERVGVTAVPAGVLTVLATRPTDGPDDALAATVVPERAGVRPTRLLVPEAAAELRRSLVVPAGRHRLGLDRRSAERWLEPLADGLHVAAEAESVARLQLLPRPPEPEPGDAVALGLDAEGLDGPPPGDPGSPSVARLRLGAALDLVLTGRADDGSAVEVETAELSWRVLAHPEAALAGPGLGRSGTARGLPVRLGPFVAAAEGRARLELVARLPDGRRLESSLRLVLLAPGATPGPPVALALEVEDPERLERGTGLELALIDAAGRYARAPAARVDLSASDPWASLPDGPEALWPPGAGGVLLRRLARPSGPRELPVVLRATVTSTEAGLTWTATAALPVLR